jgi:hypothetical protein
MIRVARYIRFHISLQQQMDRYSVSTGYTILSLRNCNVGMALQRVSNDLLAFELEPEATNTAPDGTTGPVPDMVVSLSGDPPAARRVAGAALSVRCVVHPSVVIASQFKSIDRFPKRKA